MKAGNVKIAAAAAVAVLLCVGFTYAAHPQDDGDEPFGSPWVNSNCDCNQPKERPSAKDDLYAWMNHGWLSENHADAYYPSKSIFTETYDVVREDFAELAMSGVPTTEGMLIKDLMDLATDADAREAAGHGPVIDHLDAFASADTREELEKAIADTAAFIQFCSLNVITYSHEDYVELVPSMISGIQPGYGTPSEAPFTDALRDLMEVFGFDGDEAERMALAAVEADKTLYGGSSGETHLLSEDSYPEFPLWVALRAMGMEEGMQVGMDLGWSDTLIRLADEDLYSLKCLATVSFAVRAASFLDERAWDAKTAVHEAAGYPRQGYASPGSGIAFCLDYIPSASAGLYTDRMISDTSRQRVKALVDSARETYIEMLSSCGWMDGPTLQAAVEKLERMEVIVAESTWGRDYSTLSDDREGLFGTVSAYSMFTFGRMFAESEVEYSSVHWKIATGIMNPNLYYSHSNKMMILPSVLTEPIYSDSMSEEELMSFLGWSICHELSHALDINGSTYDANGDRNDWWSPGVREEYEKRIGIVKDGLRGIEILPGIELDADRVINEYISDLCGMQCIMAMASDIDGFDHRAYFEHTARMFRNVTSQWYLQYLHDNYPYPPFYLRVNLVFQQFEQFHQAFGISEGDGMWRDPEDRLLLW